MLNKKKLQVITGLVVIIGIILIFFIISSPSHQAKNTVQSFYEFEQDGEFANSWQLFHSQMKEKFTKGAYIQDRAHVFMNHFGVTTFSFTLSNMNKVKNWSMTKDAKPIDVVYTTTVTQTFKGKYGNFKLSQDIFVTEEKGQWTILWDYNP